MKRAWKISESTRRRLHRYNARSSIQGPRSFTVTRSINDCHYLTSTSASTSESTSASVTPSPTTSRKLQSLVKLFIKKFSDTENDPWAMRDEVSAIRKNLLSHGNEPDEITRVLDQVGHHWFRSYPKGSVFTELLQQLSSSPDVALVVCIYITCVRFFLISYQLKIARSGFSSRAFILHNKCSTECLFTYS